MIDAHCHLMHEQFNAGRAGAIRRARDAGLKAIIETGGNLEQNQRALELQMQHKKFIFSAIGLAPHYVLQADAKKEFEHMERNADHVVAIGEIGLEYHHFPDENARARQRQVFREQLILAEKLQLPAVTHCREAYPDLMLILKDFPLQKVMLHFFNRPEMLQEALRRGYMLSISTLKSKELDKIMKLSPINSLLCETDSPYMWQGQRNEPANVKFVYERMAEIKGLPVDEIKSAVRANAAKFFELVF